MLALIRGGYGREIVALFILTVLLSALLVGGVGALVDGWFAQSVESLVGVPGEYDVIVQLQAEAGRQAVLALHERLSQIAPGYRLKEGPTLIGRSNIFVGFSKAHRNAETFETLEDRLRDVPGFDGLSIVVEPAVLIKDVHENVRERFLEEALLVPETLFGFEHNGNLWIVTDRAGAAEDVRRRLESIGERLGILDLRLPVPLDQVEQSEIASRVERAVWAEHPSIEIAALANGESQTVRDLAEVKRLLTEVGGAEREALQQSLEQAREAISKAAAEGSVREDIKAVLDTFEQAVLQLESLERRALELSAQLKESAAAGGTTDVLIALLLERLIAGFQGDTAETERQPAIDELKSGIASLVDRLVAIETVDFDSILDGLRRLEASAASFDRETEERMLDLIDRAIQAQGGDGVRLEFLLEGEWARIDPGAIVAEIDGDSVRAYVRPAGVVEPDPRTVLSQLLSRATDAVVLLTALLAASVFFFLDMATIVSYARSADTSAAPQGPIGRGRSVGVVAWGGAWMAATLSAVVWLAGGWEGVALLAPVVGFVIGALFSMVSHRVSPVDLDEVQAGLSLGLGGAQVLREIVVPGSRPGLLIWLNQYGRRLPGAART